MPHVVVPVVSWLFGDYRQSFRLQGIFSSLENLDLHKTNFVRPI
jgi:hypothetical protein